MNEQWFFERVARRCGLEQGPPLDRMVTAALRALGEALSADEARLLHDELPPRLAEALDEVEHGQPRTLEAIVARLESRTGARPGVALEQLGIVAATLAEGVRAEAMDPIRRGLPRELRRLFLPPPIPHQAPAVHHDARHRTLAEATAVSARPLYAAKPLGAQSNSVVRADNPHAETKLSSAQGLTQEREDETLASAHAPPDELATAHR